MERRIEKVVLPAPDVVGRPGIEAGAAIYLVGTKVEFVTVGSDMEAAVLAAGAIRVGSLRFDAPTVRRPRRLPGRPIRMTVRRARAVALHERN